MRYLVRVEPVKMEMVQRELGRIGITLVRSVFDYWVIDIPQEQVERVRAISGVIDVVPERKVGLTQTANLKVRPIPIEAKMAEFARLFTSNPITGPISAFKFAAEADAGIERWPTGESRKVVGADIAESDGITGKGIKVALIDTGAVPTFQGHYLEPDSKSSVEGMPLPWDENGHGCTSRDTLIYTSLTGVGEIGQIYNRLAFQFGEHTSELGKTINLDACEIYTYSINPDTLELEKTKVLAAHKVKVNECLEIHAGYQDGRNLILRVTPWHPCYAINGTKLAKKRADEIEIGDNLIVPEQTIEIGEPQILHGVNVTEDHAYLAGLLAGDGHFRADQKSCILAGNKEILDHASVIAAKLGFDVSSVRQDGAKYELNLGKDAYIIFSWLLERDYWTNHNNWRSRRRPGKTYNIKFPEVISKSSKAVIGAFIAGLLDSDGWIHKNQYNTGFSTVSESLAKQLCFILNLIGLRANLTERPAEPPRAKAYRIDINGIDRLEKFYKLVRKYSIKARPLVERITNANTAYSHPHIASNGNYRTETVNYIRKVKVKTNFYDLTVERFHNYLAGTAGLGVISNTWCATCISGESFQTPFGLLKGIAPDCQVQIFKCLGYFLGAGSDSSVMRAMMDAYEWGADIISASLGSPYTEEPPETIPNCRAVRMLTNAGVINVWANGNDGPEPNTVGVPANEPSALSVGAIDKEGKIAEFSSRGKTAQGLVKPDCVAPGVYTTSSSTGLIALMQMGRDFPGTASISGTSMATPHCSGIVALALQYARSKGKNLTTDHIKEAMDLWGEYPGGAKNSDYGWGLITYQLLKRYVDEKLS
jgi:hypothetical protein